MIKFILLIPVATAIVILGFKRGNNIRATKPAPKNSPWPSRIVSTVIASALLLASGILPNPLSASAEGNETTTTTTTVLTQKNDPKDRTACAEGLVDSTFSEQDLLTAESVTPPLPEADPDAMWEALFGPKGYACGKDERGTNVAAMTTLVGSGFLVLGNEPDPNTLAAEFRSDPAKQLALVQQAAHNFYVEWNGTWTPSNATSSANFLITVVGPPKSLGQVQLPVKQPIGVYTFKDVYNDVPTNAKVVTIKAQEGWLIFQDDKFPNTPVCIPLGLPDFTSDAPAQEPDTTLPGSPSKQGTSGPKEDKSKKKQGGGDKASESGSDKGNSGGGGSSSGSSGSTGGDDGNCGGNCNGGGGDDGGSSCTSGCGGTTPSTTAKPCNCPPPTSPPTTKPPATTVPKTTVPPTSPPTTRPPATTTPPTTAPPTTAPPTTRPPATTTTLKPPPPTTVPNCLPGYLC